MSPKTLGDYVGQEEILGQDKILYRTIKADRLSSIILWGNMALDAENYK